MSRQATDWAWSTDLKGNEKFLLIALANYADENWTCYPGQERLASDIGSTRGTVTKIIASLEEKGYIQRHERRRQDGYRTSNRYLLNPAMYEIDTKGLMYEKPDSHVRKSEVSCIEIVRKPVREPLENQSEDIRGRVDEPLEQAFETVWRDWPKKADRKDAWLRFRTTYRNHFREPGGLDRLVGKALDHSDAYRKYRQDPKFIPAFSVWLNKERWREDPITAPTSNVSPVQKLELTDRERELISGKRR
jgi:biotin operon repressor